MGRPCIREEVGVYTGYTNSSCYNHLLLPAPAERDTLSHLGETKCQPLDPQDQEYVVWTGVLFAQFVSQEQKDSEVNCFALLYRCQIHCAAGAFPVALFVWFL